MALARDSFADLATRVATGAAIACVGLAAVWAGGWWFTGLVLAVVATLVWELVRMLGGGPRRARMLGAMAAAAILAVKLLPVWAALPLAAAVPVTAVAVMQTNRRILGGMLAMILVAGVGLILHRDSFGLVWMLWLVLLVAATDILGYFAGRILGGPKFWPRVSPKKTWSGTVAGWVGAALVGWAFMAATGSGPELIAISVLLSFAGQMGDILESAVKRHAGVKDSSNLLPGHGGVYDRFDALLGAAFVLVIIETFTAFPLLPG
ncbi:phosphatidate cytidylyltransferase [Roseicyclus persicicus]|uniref:Phosphatidate cytidylyltransferase n=1 Tax=Roseicyclus persicicus TaxID=2650661 RepID=A0A7X6H3A9_9RHOB|nr:phosphatidate cytidylyltransferase [Roseibacterium persicicum]NKX45997.1 phosphatidate cytidylyltransferase [Roseibacterium persicicum]